MESIILFVWPLTWCRPGSRWCLSYKVWKDTECLTLVSYFEVVDRDLFPESAQSGTEYKVGECNRCLHRLKWVTVFVKYGVNFKKPVVKVLCREAYGFCLVLFVCLFFGLRRRMFWLKGCKFGISYYQITLILKEFFWNGVCLSSFEDSDQR